MNLSIDTLSLVIAIVGSTVTIVGAMLALFLWVRSEANTDRKNISDIQREDRKELLQISRNLELAVSAIQQEMKDFHGRLCAIEERKVK